MPYDVAEAVGQTPIDAEYAVTEPLMMPAVDLSPEACRRLSSLKYVRRRIAETAPAAVDYLAEVISDCAAEPSMRLKAAESVLDRFLGKARQSVEVEHREARPIVFDARLERLRQAAVDARGAEDAKVRAG